MSNTIYRNHNNGSSQIAVVAREHITSQHLDEIVATDLVSRPTKEVKPTPQDENLTSFASTSNITLSGFFLPCDDSDKVILYLKGGDRNVSVWVKAAANIQEQVRANILIADYRGFGRSTGTPSVKGYVDDVFAMYDYLVSKLGFEPENISVYGRSLGGALGTELAAKEKVRSLVLQSSFSSLRGLAKDYYNCSATKLIPDYLNSAARIQEVSAPVLVSHGSHDEILPTKHALELYSSAPNPYGLIILDGAGHDHLKSYFTPEYFEALRELFL